MKAEKRADAKKQKRPWSGAKVFFLSFALTFLILLGAAFFVMAEYTPQAEQFVVPDSPSVYIPRESDTFLMLTTVAENRGDTPFCFALTAFDPSDVRIPVTVFLAQTELVYSGETTTLQEVYKSGGIKACVTALENLLSIRIDRFAQFTQDSLIQSVDLVGKLELTMPFSLHYSDEAHTVDISEGLQLADGRMIYDIISFPAYENGDIMRAEMTEYIFAAYINRYLADAASESFPHAEKLFNLVETSLSHADYIGLRESFQFLAEAKARPAVSVQQDGDYSPDYRSFIIQDESLVYMKGMFR